MHAHFWPDGRRWFRWMLWTGLVLALAWLLSRPAHAWLGGHPYVLRWAKHWLARDGVRGAAHLALFAFAALALGLSLAPVGRWAPLLAGLPLLAVALARDGAPLLTGDFPGWTGPSADLLGDALGLALGLGWAFVWAPVLRTRGPRLRNFWIDRAALSLWWSLLLAGLFLLAFPVEAWAASLPETWRWFRWIFASDWIQWAFHATGFALAAAFLGWGLARVSRFWPGWTVLALALMALVQEGMQMRFLGFRGWVGLLLDFMADGLGVTAGLLLLFRLLRRRGPSSR